MSILDNPLFVSALMLAWGMVVRYKKSFEAWPNRLIVWMNLAIGLLAKLAVANVAHAGSLHGVAVVHSVGHWLGPFLIPAEAFLARAVFETLVKPTLEHFGIVGYPARPAKLIQGRDVTG